MSELPYDSPLSELILPYITRIVSTTRCLPVLKTSGDQDMKAQGLYSAIQEIFQHFLGQDIALAKMTETALRVDQIIRTGNEFYGADFWNAKFEFKEGAASAQKSLTTAILFFAESQNLVPGANLHKSLIHTLNTPNDGHPLARAARTVFWWINKALAFMKPVECKCIRTVAVTNNSEFEYY